MPGTTARRDRVVLVLAAVALLANIVVHLATFWPAAHIPMRFVWPLFLPTIVAFAMALLPWQKGRETIRWMPLWVVAVCIALMVYGVVNFFVLIPRVSGVPMHVDGEYRLVHKGAVIRTLSYEEFRRLESLETRGASGELLIFSLFAVVGAAHAVARSRKSERSAASE